MSRAERRAASGRERESEPARRERVTARENETVPNEMYMIPNWVADLDLDLLPPTYLTTAGSNIIINIYKLLYGTVPWYAHVITYSLARLYTWPYH